MSVVIFDVHTDDINNDINNVIYQSCVQIVIKLTIIIGSVFTVPHSALIVVCYIQFAKVHCDWLAV